MSTEQYIKLIYIVKVEESSHQTGTGYTTDDDLFCKIDWIQMGKIQRFRNGIFGVSLRVPAIVWCTMALAYVRVAEQEIETYFMNV